MSRRNALYLFEEIAPGDVYYLLYYTYTIELGFLILVIVYN